MSRIRLKITSNRLAATALLVVCSAVAQAAGSRGSGTVSITTLDTPITQDFNTIGASSLPTGWYLNEAGTGGAADGNLVAGNGSSNSGGAYSFGADSATDRALGSLGSGTVTPITYGAMYTNNTGGTITSLEISYSGEQWRRGTATGDLLSFSYNANVGANLTSTGYTAVDALNFVSPGNTCSSTTGTQTNGNSVNCRKLISATISGLNIPDGATIWIRWIDVDTTGSDDGLAIDDLSVTARGTAPQPGPKATGTANPSTVAGGATTTLSGTITPGTSPASASYTVTCDLSAIGGSAAQNLPVTGTTFSYLATVATSTAGGAHSLSCTVTDDLARAGSFTISLTTTAPAFACGAGATAIHDIQGAGLTSPMSGQAVDVEGIVVGTAQGSNKLGGYYLQQPDGAWDSDPATSEGIFVYEGGTPTTTVKIGDRVRVHGTISEYTSTSSGLSSQVTELDARSQSMLVCSSGNSFTRTTITLPVENVSDWEHYEGMAVQITQPLVVTGDYSLGTFGQIDLAPQLLYQPTQFVGTRTSWQTALDLNKRSLITLDDNSSLSYENLYPTLLPIGGLSASNTVRAGARVNFNAATGAVSPLYGVVDDRYGAYRISPTGDVTFDNTSNPRPAIAPILAAAHGRFRVVSANVLNFFTTFGSRGAANQTEYDHQAAKLVAELSKMDADIYCLSEIQNYDNGSTGGSSNTWTNAALDALLHNLNGVTGKQTWAYINTLPLGNLNGTDAIRSAILYKTARVTPVGSPAAYYQNDQNRPSLAQTFKPAAGAKADHQTFTVVVNHLRSKGSACGGSSDDTYQGNCNGMRTSMIQAVHSWLGTNPTLDPAASRKYLLVGDFNAYYGEDPIQYLATNGYTDLLQRMIGSTAYSYNYGSQAGFLDHAIANAALRPLVSGVAVWHINTDEPSSLQALKTADKSAAAIIAYYSPDEFAASDHDPIVIGLNPLPGDVNDDGVVDAHDRDLITAAYGKAANTVDPRLDFDGDGTITVNDYRFWLTNCYKPFIQ